jgi:hypothetical protein
VSDYDLLVLGCGPGGQKAAIAAAKLGKRAAVVERSTPWGTSSGTLVLVRSTMMFTAMRGALRVTVPCVISAGILLTGESAEANPADPALLAQDVPMPCVPPCTLCHATLAGGPGNVLTYGIETTWTNPEITMGSVLDDSQVTLVPTLDAIRKLNPPLDSDKDGIPDLTELMMGENPNLAGSAWLCDEAGGHGLPNKTVGADASDSGIASDTRSAANTSVRGCARVAPKGDVDNAAAISSAVVLLMGSRALRRRRSSTQFRATAS